MKSRKNILGTGLLTFGLLASSCGAESTKSSDCPDSSESASSAANDIVAEISNQGVRACTVAEDVEIEGASIVVNPVGTCAVEIYLPTENNAAAYLGVVTSMIVMSDPDLLEEAMFSGGVAHGDTDVDLGDIPSEIQTQKTSAIADWAILASQAACADVYNELSFD